MDKKEKEKVKKTGGIETDLIDETENKTETKGKKLRDFSAILKEAKFVSKPSRFNSGVDYFVRVRLANDKTTDISIKDKDKGIIDLVKTCKDLGIEPIKGIALEERVSDEKISKKTDEPAVYTAVIFTMYDDSEYNFFLPRPFLSIVKLLYEKQGS